MNLATPITGTFVLALFAARSEAQSPVKLNEIYASHSGVDTAEYIELVGPPDFPLDNHLVLIVEGEGAAAGTLDRVWDLSGLSIPPSGYFVLGDSALPADFDIGASNSIENGTETFYLVVAQEPQAFQGLLGTDISNGLFTTQIPGLALILDHVALIDPDFPADRVFDFPLVIGPDGPFFPPGIYRGQDFRSPWCAGAFLDFTVGGVDQPQTPGTPNPMCPPALPGNFFGLDHKPLGLSALERNEVGDLVISNIGSSGLDGVCIELGVNEAFVTGMTLDPAAWPLGATMRSVFTANVNGVPGQPGGTLGLRRDPTGFTALPNFSALGAPTYSVQIFDGGQEVFSQGGFSGPAVTMQIAAKVVLKCDCLLNFWCWQIDDDIPFDISGAATVLGDHIVFSADLPAPSAGFLEAVDILGLDLGGAVIEDEALRLFGGNDHRALGEARFDSSGGGLTISQIGSSGLDGVCIDYGVASPEEGLDVIHTPIALQPGEGYRASATGNFGGVPGSDLGNATWLNNGGQGQARADFSSIGSTDVRIQVLDGGSLVGEAVVPGGGVVADVNPGPAGPGAFISTGKLPPDPPCFVVGLDRPVSVSPIGGQGPFVGDEVRLLAENPTAPILAIELFDLQFMSLAQVTILDELSLPGGPVAYCDPGSPNSVSPDGAVLQSTSGYGTAAASFDVIDTPPGQPGVLFTGNSDPGSLPFGCGLRCVGGSVLRYGPFFPPPGQTALSQTIDMSISGNDRIQWWYRDPVHMPACGGTFNLSNALRQ